MWIANFIAEDPKPEYVFIIAALVIIFLLLISGGLKMYYSFSLGWLGGSNLHKHMISSVTFAP